MLKKVNIPRLCCPSLTWLGAQQGRRHSYQSWRRCCCPFCFVSYFMKGEKIFSVAFLGTDYGSQPPPDVKCFSGFLVTYQNLTSRVYQPMSQITSGRGKLLEVNLSLDLYKWADIQGCVYTYIWTHTHTLYIYTPTHPSLSSCFLYKEIICLFFIFSCNISGCNC